MITGPPVLAWEKHMNLLKGNFHVEADAGNQVHVLFQPGLSCYPYESIPFSKRTRSEDRATGWPNSIRIVRVRTLHHLVGNREASVGSRLSSARACTRTILTQEN